MPLARSGPLRRSGKRAAASACPQYQTGNNISIEPQPAPMVSLLRCYRRIAKREDEAESSTGWTECGSYSERANLKNRSMAVGAASSEPLSLHRNSLLTGKFCGFGGHRCSSPTRCCTTRRGWPAFANRQRPKRTGIFLRCQGIQIPCWGFEP